jgi:pyruvate carboxylase
MLTALKNFRIEGLSTNTNFLKRVIDHQAFRSGDTHTSFVDKYRDDIILD